MRNIVHRLAAIASTFLFAAGVARADGYFQTNLVSDQPGMAEATDPNLINPWGISFSATSPFWISNQAAGAAGTGTATVHSVPAASGGLTTGGTALTVTVPNLGGAAPSDANGPTGQVSTGAPGITTGTSDFLINGAGTKAAFIFANLDGSISAWRPGSSSATLITTATVPGASFTGLAIGNSGGAAFLYAADQNSGNIYKFDSSWHAVGTLTDPNLPAGYTAFNVQNIGGVLYVTYAVPNVPNGGVVDEFSTDGSFLKRLITDTGASATLQTPWGVAVAPAGWGTLGGDLLVGNNDGDGTINAFSLADGSWKGHLMLANGTAFSQGELWGLTFGNGSGAGSSNILYFAAGLPDADHGLFGALSVPEPGSAVLGLIALGTLAAGRYWKRGRRPANS